MLASVSFHSPPSSSWSVPRHACHLFSQICPAFGETLPRINFRSVSGFGQSRRRLGERENTRCSSHKEKFSPNCLVRGFVLAFSKNCDEEAREDWPCLAARASLETARNRPLLIAKNENGNMFLAHGSMFRSIVMRSAYLSPDRADLAETIKVVTRLDTWWDPRQPRGHASGEWKDTCNFDLVV